MSFYELRKAILELAGERDHLTFVEIMAKFPEEKGDCHISLTGYGNIWMWADMSENMAAAVNDIMQSHDLHVHPATQFTYLLAGGGLKLPFAEAARQFNKPHWFPVTLDKSHPKGVN